MTTVPPSVERRRAPRIDAGAQVVVKPWRRINYPAFLHDLSEEGTYFVAEEKIPANTEVLIYAQFAFSKSRQLCMLHGKIVRVHERAGEQERGYAVKFDSGMSASARDLLGRYLRFKITGRAPTFPLPTRKNDSSTTRTAPVGVDVKHLAKREPVRKLQAPRITTGKSRRPKNASINRGKFLTAFWVSAAASVVLIAIPIKNYVVEQQTINRLKETLPMIYIKITDGSLRAQIQMDWVNNKPPAKKAEDVLAFRKQLSEEGITTARLVDKLGNTVVLITPTEEGPEKVSAGVDSGLH